jgi:OFA family oxalate/formate antiporter-like MFS transporter
MPASAGTTAGADSNRWAQLIIGIVCMILIANLQYGWTLFVHPMAQAHGWKIAEIQVAFAIFIALETWLTPVEGWIVDSLGPKLGPKLVVAVGGLLVALAWIINSFAGSLTMLYVGAALSGVGAGAIYATCVGNAVKWFADRRGLAVGLTAAGFGAGAAVTVVPIRMLIASQGYAATFFWFGIVQGGVIFIVAWLLRGPLPGEARLAVSTMRVEQVTSSLTPGKMLTTPTFWLLYVMFILVSASGLMATAQIALIARDFGLSNTVLLFGGTTLTIALVIDNVLNGSARPFFGWISDHIGREYTMALAFGLGGIAYWLLGTLGTSPWAFVLFAGLIFFTWGEIFSLFPSTCTDTFGPKYATVNTSLLYTAKGVSAFLVPFANVLKAETGSWHAVFVITAIANFVVVALALFVLRPIRAGQIRGTQRDVEAVGARGYRA